MVALLVFVYVLPLIATGTASFGEADHVCFESFKHLWAQVGTGVLGQKNKDATPWDREYVRGKVPEGWHAHIVLLPAHYMHCASAIPSLLGTLFWLFHSPHQQPNETAMDRKLMSFFACQFISDIAVAASNLHFCSPKITLQLFLFTTYNGSLWGMSVLGTNFLAQRYLFDRAKFAAGKADLQSYYWTIPKLAAYFDWAVKGSIVYVSIGSCLMLVVNSVPWVMDVLMMLLCAFAVFMIFVNGLFSICLHAIFLRPIVKLQQALRSIDQHQNENLAWVRSMTVLGSIICLGSSTLLNVSVFVGSISSTDLAFDGGRMHGNPWLNPMVFGNNLDGVLNVVGLLIVAQAIVFLHAEARHYRSEEKRAPPGISVAFPSASLHSLEYQCPSLSTGEGGG